jgi:hypothetical protein
VLSLEDGSPQGFAHNAQPAKSWLEIDGAAWPAFKKTAFDARGDDIASPRVDTGVHHGTRQAPPSAWAAQESAPRQAITGRPTRLRQAGKRRRQRPVTRDMQGPPVVTARLRLRTGVVVKCRAGGATEDV